MYQLLKFVHVVSVVLFLGNIITGLFWKWHADRTRSAALIAHAFRGIILADRIFTIPGVVLITATGILAAMRGGFPILGTGWILWSIILFALSGVAFGWKVAPLQKRIAAMTENATEVDWAAYRRISLEWELWGLFATLTPLAATALMVMKPRW
jgi:uncharacterized membrane protein